jgi:hypothetical protein
LGSFSATATKVLFGRRDSAQMRHSTKWTRTRPLGTQGQLLLSQRQILQKEVFSGPKHSHQPAEQASKARKHGGNLTR